MDYRVVQTGEDPVDPESYCLVWDYEAGDPPKAGKKKPKGD